MADEKKETETKKQADDKSTMSDLPEQDVAPQNAEQVKGGLFSDSVRAKK